MSSEYRLSVSPVRSATGNKTSNRTMNEYVLKLLCFSMIFLFNIGWSRESQDFLSSTHGLSNQGGGSGGLPPKISE